MNSGLWSKKQQLQQAFINYNFFSYTRFCARKTVLGASLCTWEIVHVKEQTCMLLIITWYGGRKCTKLVLKPLAAKNGLSILVMCTAPFLKIILFQFTWWPPSWLHYAIFLRSSATIFGKLKWEVVQWIWHTDHWRRICSSKFQFSSSLHTAGYHYLF